ncbi:hypothetical protein EW146_g5383 [Bondarzewia mesenterica]|uniref:RlpA-like protein double-psi beta-barrel domain-containing protein n=1 Tax=Bondarzewia mesenterica TaxID=1095465 RepID=A0A4S4LSP4_9AGAM|nr:hypothetical protein EW146_g5383 [Bondarzewia mesenterica]
MPGDRTFWTQKRLFRVSFDAECITDRSPPRVLSPWDFGFAGACDRVARPFWAAMGAFLRERQSCRMPQVRYKYARVCSMVALTRLVALVSVFTAGSVMAAPAHLVRRSFSGDGTFYAPGLGSCGISNTASDFIVAISHDMFDTFPGAGPNPNTNPVCGKKVTASFQGKSVTATVVDRCAGCNTNDLDFSPAAFDQLADPSLGRIAITWDFA